MLRSRPHGLSFATSCHLFILAIACAPALGAEEARPDSLRVALYDLPGSEGMQEVIREKWQAIHPEVGLAFAAWESYKQDPPSEVDVFEYDAIFLQHMAKEGIAAELMPDEIENRDDIMAFALEGSKVGDAYYGIPRIACTPVIFYREGDAEVERATSIEDLYRVLGDRLEADLEPRQGEGLLIDLSSSTACACYYLDAVADATGEYTTTPELPCYPMLDEVALGNLQLLTRMAGRRQAVLDFDRCDWFAQGKGRALVGWTERLWAIPLEKHAELSVRSFPLAEANAVNLVYVDVLSINSALTAGRRQLAIEFANLVASKEVVIATFLVRNEETNSPHYLLPVRESVLADSGFREAAPLYDELAPVCMQDPRAFQIGENAREWLCCSRKAIQKAITELK